ncbi:cation:proton antiporter [Burkholderiaceae bacterium FT117]|uniref:cation:proton antiporter n=1 Tax=Zeimonas sediminis TaxID=2944268 RepID=UPI0023430E32|nr:sodium:proton antiporter [Zeimonas sediminis]MCM5570371.1 cation:proton antiporter [Zeimonas sediminis]
MTEHPIVALAAIGALGAAAQWLAWRVRLPAIVFLLLAGIAVGPVAGWLDPDALFGELLFPLVSLAVGLILFEGALTLRLSEIAGLERIVRRMVGSGALITWAVAASAAHWLAGLSWPLATLFGAIMIVTGPTVIVPMLRTVRPNARVASVLRWEGIVIDPVGAFLAVLVFQFVVSAGEGGALLATAWIFAKMTMSGLVVGAVLAFLLGEALRRHLVPVYLYNVLTLASVFAALALSDMLAHESGLLAVTVMGAFLANRKGVPVEEILEFKEHLSLLLIAGLFILLAARLDLDDLRALGLPSLGVFAAMQFVARPLKILWSTMGSSLGWNERVLLAWIAPRGIVAAAVSGLFAFQLDAHGFEGAASLVPLTFVVIIGTVVLQSLTAGPLARALGVAEPEPRGLLIVGANPLARAIAKVLVDRKLPVMLTDTQWDSLSRARMLGIRTYFGNPLSEHAEVALDLSGLGTMLAMTSDPHLNALACERLARDLGPNKVYQLRVTEGESRAVASGRGRDAFGEGASYEAMNRELARGAQLRATTLTETYGFDALRARERESFLPLFALDPKGKLRVFAVDSQFEPQAGWTVIAMSSAQSVSRTSGTGGRTEA